MNGGPARRGSGSVEGRPKVKGPNAWRSWRELRPLLVGSRWRFLLLSVSAALGGIAEAGILVLVVRIAVAIAAGETRLTETIGPLGISVDVTIAQLFVAALALALVRVALNAVSSFLAAQASTESLANSRKHMLQAFLSASWELQAREREGHLQELLSTHVNKTASAVIVLAAGLVAMFNFLALTISAMAVNLLAAGAIFLAVAVLFFALRPLSRSSRRFSLLQAQANIALVGVISESVTMAQEVKTFDVAPALRQRAGVLIDDVSRPYLRNRFLGKLLPGLYQTTAMILVLLGLAAVAALGVSELASLGAVVLLLLRALAYSQVFQNTFHQLNDFLPYVDQLFEKQAEYERAAVHREGEPLERVDELAMAEVSFAYHPGEPVLRDISFGVRRGEAVGIIGPSGSGKSSLIQLLLRLRQPTEGQYLVNGVDAQTFALSQWYQRVAFVPQDSRLFAGTVAENIRFFRDHVDQDAVEAAARMAQIHDDITSWPLGYETYVGERGGGVSGGQRQRICLARALVDDPDIIVLDEPTSSLDLQSESLVQETLERLKGSVTFFIVAHRLSTLNICDRILVLENGRMKGFDHATALLESNDFYREAARLSQLR